MPPQEKRGESQSHRPVAASGGVGGAYDRKVDVGLRHLVQEVGEAILGHDGDDLDDLAVAKPASRTDLISASLT